MNVKVKDVGELDTKSRRNLHKYFKEVMILSSSDDASPELT
jgi:hypothetical protein